MDGGLLVGDHGRGHVGLECGRWGHPRGERRGGLRVIRDFLAGAATGPGAVLAAGCVATSAGRAGVVTVGALATMAAGRAVALPAVAAQAQGDQDAAVAGLATEHGERLGEIDRGHRRRAGPPGSGRRGDGVRPTACRRTVPPRRPKAREVVAPGPSSFPRPGTRTPPREADESPLRRDPHETSASTWPSTHGQAEAPAVLADYPWITPRDILNSSESVMISRTPTAPENCSSRT